MIELDWSRIEGEALEKTEFRRRSDPRVHWQVGNLKPRPDDNFRIVEYYNFDVEKLPCCFCQRALHYSGAVILLLDGSARLVGQCCGKKHLESWNHEKNSFEDARRKAEALRRARAILNRDTELRLLAAQLRGPFYKLEQERRALSSALHTVFPQLCRALRDGEGSLSVSVRLSAEALGARNVEGVQAGGRVSAQQLRYLGVLPGWEMFSMKSFRNHIENEIESFYDVLDRMRREFDRGWNLAGVLKRYNDECVKLDRAAVLYNEARRYMSKGTADRLNEWIRAESATGIELGHAERKFFIHSPNHEGVLEVHSVLDRFHWSGLAEENIQIRDVVG